MAQHACQHGATRRPRALSSCGLVGSDVLVVDGARHFLLARCRADSAPRAALLTALAHGTVGEEGDASRNNREDRNHQVHHGSVVGSLWALLRGASRLLRSEVSGLGQVECVEILLSFRVVAFLSYAVDQVSATLHDREFAGGNVKNGSVQTKLILSRGWRENSLNVLLHVVEDLSHLLFTDYRTVISDDREDNDLEVDGNSIVRVAQKASATVGALIDSYNLDLR